LLVGATSSSTTTRPRITSSGCSQVHTDGVPFFQRPYFSNPIATEAIGAHDFGDLSTQHVVVRTERFSGKPASVPQILQSRWPQLVSLASAHGLSSVYL
jgi:hypothetical protein